MHKSTTMIRKRIHVVHPSGFQDNGFSGESSGGLLLAEMRTVISMVNQEQAGEDSRSIHSQIPQACGESQGV